MGLVLAAQTDVTQRLEAILNNRDKPVQFIFAGKAHPRDNEGKALIQHVIEFSRRSGLRRKVLFLEDYDMQIGRYLVQGCDVWLNTPRRPHEACGTSGMKAALNGVLNLSVLDGWWAEGYCKECGWAIGDGDDSADPAYIDAVDSQALYNLLENDVIPKFYDRTSGEAPAEWVRMMKTSMKLAMQNYCSQRMVNDYDERYYIPAALWSDRLLADGAVEAWRLSAQHERLLNHWPGLRLDRPIPDADGPFRVGDTFRISTVVHLGELRPEEVTVHLYYGTPQTLDTVRHTRVVEMAMEEDLGSGNFRYGSVMECSDSGRYAFTARITPNGDAWIKNQPGLITWA
jgi:starch phosphorylase